jgi:hypothetical protein
MFNARSIGNKIPDLNLVLSNHPDVVLITESWCKPDSIPDSLLSFNGSYAVYRVDREGATIGGGVVALVKLDINHFCVESVNFSEYCQLLVLELPCATEAPLVCLLYRSPSCSVESFAECLQFLSGYNQKVCILAGDLNLPDINWFSSTIERGKQTPSNKLFLDFAVSSGFEQYVDKPTRKDNILDLVLCNKSGLVTDCEVSAPFSVSADHNSVLFELNDAQKVENETHWRYNFAGGDYEKITNSLCSIDWTGLLTSLDANSMYDCFVNVCYELIDMFVPKMVKKEDCKLPKRILNLQRSVQQAYKARHRIGLSKYLKQGRKQRSSLFALRLQKEKSISESGNVKRFFQFCNSKLKYDAGIGILKNETGNITFDNDKAEAFANYFKSFYVHDNSAAFLHDHLSDVGSRIDYCDIDICRVAKQLKELPLRVSTSPDKLPYYFLRKAADGLAVPLTIMFNTFLTRGEVPELWKIGCVRPIHKKGSRHSVKNYRPVCLTSSVSKVMERLVRQDLLLFLQRTGKLSSHQHGFLPKKSTTTALTTVFSSWHRALEAKQSISVALIDYSKAFDSIHLQTLFEKMWNIGIRGSLYKFLVSFLSNRKQSVMVGTYLSSVYDTPSGVPQGTCLGPLLFLVYVNDLPTALPQGVHCPAYADDTKLFTIDNPELLQKGLDALVEWSKKSKLQINTAKTQILKIGYENDLQYTFDGIALESSERVTDLGITYDKNLSFNCYIDMIIRKATARSNFVLKCFATRDLKILARLFQVFVRPLLEYATQIWSPSQKIKIDGIEGVQKKYTLRCVKRHGLLRESYTDRLKRMRLESLEERRQMYDHTFMYKISAGLVDIRMSDMFTMSPRNDIARGHRFKVVVPIARTRRYRDSFCVRVATWWNRLDKAIVMSNSVRSFKTKLKNTMA